MNPLAKIGALALACAFAFGAGFYTEHKFNLAAQATVEKKEIKATAAGIPQSIAASNQIQATADTGKAQVASITDAVNTRLAQHPKVNHATAQAAAIAASEVQSLSAGDQPMPFDLDTVRLLNAARQGIPADAAGGSDAQVAGAPAAARGSRPDGH
jgi:hypothetical protein